MAWEATRQACGVDLDCRALFLVPVIDVLGWVWKRFEIEPLVSALGNASCEVWCLSVGWGLMSYVFDVYMYDGNIGV